MHHSILHLPGCFMGLGVGYKPLPVPLFLPHFYIFSQYKFQIHSRLPIHTINYQLKPKLHFFLNFSTSLYTDQQTY